MLLIMMSYFNVHSKADISQLNLPHETKKTDMLRDNGNSPGNSLSQSWRRKKGCSEKDLRKRKVLSMEWKTKRVMDDESGESIEEEVSVNGMGELQCEVLVRSCRREAGSWFQRKMWTKSIAVSHAVFKAIAVWHTVDKYARTGTLLY